MTLANQRVEYGGAITAFGISHEQPVLFADGTGEDRIFDPVVVDANTTVPQVNTEFIPQVQHVADGLCL